MLYEQLLHSYFYLVCVPCTNVICKFADWGPLVDVVGYCFLNLGSKYHPQEDFVRWIQNGPKPLYFGFGSMV